jgi:hypothetical protein
MGGLGGAVLTVGAWLKRIAPLLRNLGPYAAIELLLPGGSLLALLLWLYRRRRAAAGSITAAQKCRQTAMTLMRATGSTHVGSAHSSEESTVDAAQHDTPIYPASPKEALI